MKNKFWFILFLLFLSLSVQALAGHFIHTWYESPSTSDAGEYLALAKSLVEGKGFSYDGVHPTSMRPPLYPALLALLTGTVGAWALIPLQRLLGWGTAWLCFELGNRLANPRAGMLAGIAAALYVPFQLQVFYTLSDLLFGFCFLAGILLLVVGLERPTLGWFMGSGVLLALSTLTRPTTLLLPLAWLFLLRERPSLWKPLAALLVCFGVCLAPWTLRNWVVTGRPVAVASLGSYNLWQGTYRSALLFGLGKSLEQDPAFKQSFDRLAGKDYYIDYQAEPRFAQAAKERILADPIGFGKLCVERTVRCWSAFPGTRHWAFSSPPLFALVSIFQLGILFLGAFGLFRLSGSPQRALGITWLYTLLIHVPMNLEARYLIPIGMLILVLGAVGASALFKPAT